MDIFCCERTFLKGVITMIHVDIFCGKCNFFSGCGCGVWTFFLLVELWSFFVECGHLLSGVVVVGGHYGKCGHLLWSVDIFCLFLYP